MPESSILNADRPLVLLPVRLETRFFGQELRVRIFPDRIHVDTHEPELTADELEWGKHFHTLVWNAKTDDARKEAWRQLADRFGAERAAWVARQLTPTNPADKPAQPPKFPQPPVRPENLKNETWTRAPRTAVLPDQWIASVFVPGAAPVIVTGRPILDPLPVGPNPQASTAQNDETLAIDSGMKWMVDFDEAERLGMALRVPLPPVFATSQKVDRLLVFGVKQSLDSATSLARLTALFEAHKYTDGLSLVLQGTPTNNTEGSASGFNSDDPGYEKSFRLVLGNPLFQAGDGSNGDELCKALGVPPDLFSRTANADAREQTGARDMNRALWSSTWGYYLEQMMALGLNPASGQSPGVFPVADIDANLDYARAHFVNHVRASGPLPAIRAGKQPYGLLPVTALDLWGAIPEDGSQPAKDDGTVAFLRRLQDYWQVESRSAVRMGNNANPDVDFKAVFNMDGLSSRYSLRNVFGLFYTQELFMFLRSAPPDIWLSAQRSIALGALSQIGGLSNKLPRAALTLCEPDTQDLIFSLVQVTKSADLTFNYIDQLLKAADLDSVLRHAAIPPPFSLLYLLLRHSLLLEYAGAASRILGRAPAQRAEPEHVRFTGMPMETSLDRITGAAIHTGPAFTQPADPQIQDFRKSLEGLKTLKVDPLSTLLRGTLDLSSHRLDAWVTSFATKRLKSVRQKNPSGVYLGGYGWVEDIRPAPARPLVNPPPGEPGPLSVAPNDPGFVQAPSLDHATTVAVLRSGHLTHSDPSKRDLLAVDLSSERARVAQYLLDGVRSGQPLGALLGYRFERALHDLNLDVFIDPFRQIAPFQATRVDETGQPAESVTANHVVDGLSLFRQTRDAAARAVILQRAAALAQTPVLPAISTELDRLADAVDAVSDALLSESVHHVVRGNPSRAAATLDALERGEAPPPDLEVIRTPRSGLGFTHRVVTLFPGTPAPIADWTASIRAQVEPCLNAWAAKLLGSPTRVRCVVDRVNIVTGTLVDKRELRLKDLRLGPLDVIYAQESTEDSRLSELEQRILFQIRRSTQVLANQELRFNPQRDPTWPLTDLSWSEFVEVVRAARGLLTGGRALRAGDLNVTNSPDAIDEPNLKARSDRAATALRAAQITLRNAMTAATTATLEPLRAAMHAMASFGIPGAIPLSAVGKTDEALRTLLFQAKSLDREVTDRITKVDATTDSRQRLKYVFGSSYVVLPRFRPVNAPEIQRALAASTATQDGDAMAVLTFHQRMARVREGVARLDDALRYAEALGNGDALTLQVAQLPQFDGDRWVGLPPKTGTSMPAGRLSLIVHTPEAVDLTLPVAGLLIDEWIEVIPNAKETTGVVFQYNQPDSIAPQAILIAVHPNPVAQEFWSVPWLQQVLRETIALVQLRAVTPDQLDEVAQYLPAAYFAINADGHTVSTDFFNKG
jgi:hypothetical protein